MTNLLIGVFLFLFAMVLIAVGLALKFLEDQRKKQVREMLATADPGASSFTEVKVLKDPSEESGLASLFRRFTVFERLDQLLKQSGLGWSVPGLIGAMVVSACAGLLLGTILPVLFFRYAGPFTFAVVFASLPLAYVARARRKRLAEFEEQFPEALDFLARSMKAGHAFSISLEMLGDESPEPLGQEIRKLFNELNLGAPIEVALTNFAARVPLVDVRFFVSAVMLQRQTGGNLSEILTRLSYVIRERFQLKGQVKAASAHGRITATILTIMPIVMIFAMLFVAPGYLQSMANDADGKWLILAALIAQVLGYYSMRKIVNIKI